MDRLLTLPWDQLTRAEQRLALVQAELRGEADAACFDLRLADEWRDRLAAWLVDHPDLSPEQAIYLELVVERQETQKTMSAVDGAYWRSDRSRRDPRVATLAHAWWSRVVVTLPPLAAKPWAGGSELDTDTAATEEPALV